MRAAMYDDALEVCFREFGEGIVSDEYQEFAKPGELSGLLRAYHKIGFWRFDITSGNCYWSPEVFEIHGLLPEEGPVNVKKAVTYYHPDDVEIVSNMVKTAIRTGHGYRSVLRLQRGPEKEIRLVESIGECRLGPDGKVAELFGVFRDVTEETRAGLNSERQREVITTLMKHSPAAIAVLDGNMRYLAANPRWVDLFKLRAVPQLSGKLHCEVIPNTPERWKAEHAKVCSGGGAVAVKGEAFAFPNGKRIRFNRTFVPWRSLRQDRLGVIAMIEAIDRTANEKPEDAAIDGKANSSVHEMILGKRHDARPSETAASPDAGRLQQQMQRQNIAQVAKTTTTLLNSIPQGLLFIEFPRCKVSFANQFAAEILATRATGLIGQSLRNIFRDKETLAVALDSLRLKGHFDNLVLTSPTRWGAVQRLSVCGRMMSGSLTHTAVLTFEAVSGDGATHPASAGGLASTGTGTFWRWLRRTFAI